MASRKLDLRTGRTVWLSYRAPAIPFAPLTRDARADVLIVGAGISGAMIADALSAEGLDVLVIDRRRPLAGSTMATTALVQFEIDQPLSLLARRIGRDRAERAWRRSRLAIASLQARIEELGIPCRMTVRRSLYLAGNVLDIGGLHEEAEARRRAGLYADYLSRGMLQERFGMSRDGALLSHGNLTLDPRRLAAGFLLAARRRKTRIHAPVEAVEFLHSSGGVSVATKQGPVIRASHIVLATGYELASIVPGKGHRVVSTYAIATGPQSRPLPPDMPIIWEASDPYLYLRTTHDGRVICGGEDEEFTDEERRDALLSAKAATISVRLGRLLTAIDPRPQLAWAGAFGTTQTGLPILGPVPRKPRIMAVLGYGGNGITFSRIAAELVTGHICGHGDADADLFAFEQ